MPWDPAAFARAGATLASLVPTQVHDLLERDIEPPARLRAVLVGGGAFDAGLAEQAVAHGWPMLASYGLTEAGSTVAVRDRLLSHLEARTENGDRLAFRGASLFTGYVTEEGLVDPKREGWFLTEDLGEVDGRIVRVCGRVGEFVKIGGESVDLKRLDRIAGEAGRAGHSPLRARQDPQGAAGRGARAVIAAALTFAGIVLPSLLVIAAVRRWIAPLSWRIAFLLLLLTLAFLHGAVFSTRLPVPVDEVARGYPYRGVVGEVRPRNPLTNDTVKLFLPWMQVAREELLHGRAPLWNPYSFSGYPLLGNGESAPFSPLFLATLFVPLPKQIVAMAGLKIFLGLVFGYLFLKRERVSDAAACFGAAAFAFSVYQTTVLYYSAASVSALLPAALFAIFHAMDEASKRSVVLVAIVVATLLANGHPESVLHVAVGAALAVVIDLALAPAKRDRLLRLAYPLVGALAGALLSAPAWVPTLEMIPLSSRYAALRAAPPPTALPLTALWALVTPNGFGHPLRHNWNWINNYTVVAASYIGLTVLALVMAAAISRRTTARERCWIALAVILFLVAMDWSIVGRAINALPPFSIAANDKLRVVACFFAAAVAAKVVDRVSRLAYLGVAVPLAALAIYVFARHRMLMRPIDLLPAVLLLALTPMLGASEGTGRSARRLAAGSRQASLLEAGAPAGKQSTSSKSERLLPSGWPSGFQPLSGQGEGPALLRTHWAGAVALVVTVIELFVLNAGVNALVPGPYFRPALPLIQALKARAPAEPFRVAGFDWAFLPNASAQYGLEDIRGSDPMALHSYTEYLRPLTRRDPSTDLDRLVDVNDMRLFFLGLRFLIAEPGASFGPPWTLIYSGPDGTLFENRGVMPRFYGFDALVETTQEAAGRYLIDVVTKSSVVIASSIPAAPGWRAVKEGRPLKVELDRGVFIAFRVPAGISRVEVVYRPRSFYLSLYATALALILPALFRAGNRVWTPPVMPGPCTGPDL